MGEVDWSVLDENSFVLLASDLLRANGYSVKYQGDGPDGGVDLLATQRLSFGFNDAQEFKWAVQCKFSKSTRRALSDREIKDIEGVLRSSRYAAEKLNGYMIITNRRIGQTVVERLRGINDGTEFRTSALDGGRMNVMLQAHEEIVERYFDVLGRLTGTRGSGILVPWKGASGKSGPEPRVAITVRSPDPKSEAHAVRCPALLDTGAAVTVVPSQVAEAAELPQVGVVKLSSVGGTFKATQVMAEFELPGLRPIVTQAVAVEKFDMCLIGADLLSQMTLLWDGPNQAIRLWGSESK